MIDLFTFTAEDAADSTTSPYDDLLLEDGVGLHDPSAVVFDSLSIDAVKLPGSYEEVEDGEPKAMSLHAAAARSGLAARAWALSRTKFPPGYCLVFARSAFNVDSYYGSARLGWLNARYKHRHGSRGIPADVPIWWLGGRHGYGHVAYSLGNGLCRSTDWTHSGRVSIGRIDDISRAWHLSFQGWTEDINRVHVYHPVAAFESKVPTVDVSEVIAGATARRMVRNGLLLKRAVAAEVGLGPMRLNAVLGRGFGVQYAVVQRKFLTSLGMKPTGKDVNGIPGMASLQWLGHRHRFNVVS